MPRYPNFKGRQKCFRISTQIEEYHRLKKGNSPTTNEGQILHLFQQCLDEATAFQLKREIDENPHLTVANFLAIMEKDFDKDFSAQARDEWRQVKFTNWGEESISQRMANFQSTVGDGSN